MSTEFEMAAIAAIVANCIIMAMTHADMNATWADIMSCANLGFTAFFTVEILLKFVALGFKPVLKVRGCVVCAAHTLGWHCGTRTTCIVCLLWNPGCGLG